MVKILFLEANPVNKVTLRLGEEARAIALVLQRAKHRDQLEIVLWQAARVADLQGLLRDHRPAVVHFSAHGSPASEIILEDNTGSSRPVPRAALSELLKLFKDDIRCVVLSACDSEEQALAIGEHIDCVVGMSDAIPDGAAIAFSAAFYEALGSGDSIGRAFELACNRMSLEDAAGTARDVTAMPAVATGIRPASIPRLVLRHPAAADAVLIATRDPAARDAAGAGLELTGAASVPIVPPAAEEVEFWIGRAAEDGARPVSAKVRPDGPRATGTLRLAFEPDDLARARAALNAGDLDNADVRAFGSALFRTVCDGPIGALYRAAAVEDTPPRLRLVLDDPWLAQLPWELLYDPRQQSFPALRGGVVRGLSAIDAMPPNTIESPLRVLFAIGAPPGTAPDTSSGTSTEAPPGTSPGTLSGTWPGILPITPPGIPPMADARIVERLQEAFDPLVQSRRFELQVLPRATLAMLDKALREANDPARPRPIHVVHVVAYGASTGTDDRVGLCLGHEARTVDLVDSDALANSLAARNVRLVVLQVCAPPGADSPVLPGESGLRQRDNGAGGDKTREVSDVRVRYLSGLQLIAGLAPTLLLRRIPAVMGMQVAGPDDAAIQFARNFYEALAGNAPVDAAMVTATRLAHSGAAGHTANAGNLGLPVCYLRTATGRVLDIAAPGAAEPVWRIPEQPSEFTFVGRRAELAEIQAWIGAHRLVTLTGPGGIGKTCLALQAARALQAGFRDGAALVELEPLTDPALLVGTIAQALGLREVPGEPLIQTLTSALAGREILVVLDNSERVLAACVAAVKAILAVAPHVRLLLTSHQQLNIPGEQVWSLQPMALPDLSAPEAELAASDAVRLFVARAQEVMPDFSLDGQVESVARICARLDGIPLAIELAAARVDMLPVEAIMARLDQRFRLLTRGSHSGVAHHQTLRAAVDWGHNLLDAREQQFFRRLSVFRGWTIEAAEAVVAGSGMGGVGNGRSGGGSTADNAEGDIEAWEVLDLLDALVSKSFVVSEREGRARRFRLLDTLREYGWEKLMAAAEAPILIARHLDWCVRLAREAESGMQGAEQALWLARLDRERENLRAALAWCEGDPASAVIGLEIAAALDLYWRTRGILTEGRAHLTRLAAAAGGAAEPPLRAKALAVAGDLARQQADYGAADALLQESLALRRDAGDTAGTADTLRRLGNVADERGNYAAARQLYEECMAAYRALGDRRGEAAAGNNLGLANYHVGDFDQARMFLAESLAMFRTMGVASAVGVILANLGNVTFHQGDLEAAKHLYEESLAMARQLQNVIGTAEAIKGLGHVALGQGDPAGARRLFAEALPHIRGVGDMQMTAEWLEAMADVERAVGEHRRAVRLLAAATTLRNRIGAPIIDVELPEHEAHLAALKSALNEDDFEAEWASGAAMAWEDAAREAATGSGAPGSG